MLTSEWVCFNLVNIFNFTREKYYILWHTKYATKILIKHTLYEVSTNHQLFYEELNDFMHPLWKWNGYLASWLFWDMIRLKVDWKSSGWIDDFRIFRKLEPTFPSYISKNFYQYLLTKLKFSAQLLYGLFSLFFIELKALRLLRSTLWDVGNHIKINNL